MTGAKKYLDTADVAKIVRRDLRSAFPGTRFSVRTRRFAGGSSVDVSWTDGPTVREVDGIVGRYEGRGFDGMTDSSFFRAPVMVDGELVQTTCWLGTHRDNSSRAVIRAINRLCKLYGIDPGEIRLNERGWPKNTSAADERFRPVAGDYLNTLVYQWLEKSGRFEEDTNEGGST